MPTKKRTTRRTPKSKTPNLVNHIGIVLDSSGSMRGIEDETKAAFNRAVADIKAEAKRTGQKTTVSLMVIGDPDTRMEFFNAPVESLKPLLHYEPNSTTPLLDGVGTLAHQFEALSDSGNKNTSFLMMVITDGEENQSKGYSAREIKDTLRRLQGTDRWTFTFQVPPGHKAATMAMFGLQPGNVMEWEGSSKGMVSASVSNSRGISTYFNNRSANVSSTMDFYTDLSGVTKTTLNKTLTDVSKMVKFWKVDHESPIKEFVERKNKGSFTMGAGYYQLQKPELVQAYKQILIYDKTTQKTYAGDEARELIGLPPSSKGIEAKVDILDHSHYDIFIQSTSVNRKLPTGCKVAYRLDHTAPSKPTWAP